MGTEQEDVARHRLDRPVLVDGADEGVVGLGHDAVVAVLRDRTARGGRGEARALATAQLSVDRVVVHVRAPCAATGGDAVADEVDDLVELLAGHLGVRRGAADEREQLVGLPLLRAHFGDDLLRGDVERQGRQLDGVEPTRPHRGEERGALDELVARQRVEASLRRARPAVVRAADALQERGDAARRADLAHQLHRPDVDPQLERRGGHQRPQVAGTQSRLDPVPALLREAAVVSGDDVVAQALAELVREPLGQPAGVDEHDGGAVLLDQRSDAVEHVAHLLRRRDRLQLSLGELECEVEVALVTGVDDGREGTVADQQTADGLDRTLGGREPDPMGAGVTQRLEPLEGQREVRAALVARDGVDLVDDDRLHRAQELPTLVAGDEQVQRLGRGDHEARRLAQHGGALGARGVTGADRDADAGRGEPELGREVGDLTERAFEVLGDVDGQRLQRRDVDHAGEPVDGLAALVGAVEPVDADHEPGERLARARGRGDQGVAPGLDVGPPLGLRGGRALGEATPEPLGDGGVEAAQRRVQGLAAVELGGEQREGQRGHSFIVADGYDTHQGDLRKRRRLGGPRTRRTSHGQDHRSRRRRRRAHPSVVALARARCRGRRAERRRLRRSARDPTGP